MSEMTVIAETREALPVEEYREQFRRRLQADDSVLDPFRAGPGGRDGRLGHEETVALGLEITRLLWAEGWKRHGWPAELGGLGGGVRHRAVYYDELCRAGLFVPESDNSLEVLSPAVLRFAPNLAREMLPGMLSGQEVWGQGFSEPEAGSDLAALRTRAVPSDEGYTVSGQKIWTSNGHLSARLFTLVRTGAPDSRRNGISALLIDADSPGITRRPLRFASGVSEMCETFFDEVEVPADRLIGEENEGWEVAGYLLQYERSMYAAQRQAWLFSRLRDLSARVAAAGPAGGASDSAAADILGRAWSAVATLRARTASTVRRLDAGELVGPEASADKLLLGTAEQTVFDAVRELLGEAFLLDDADEWRSKWWYSRAATIYGGSAEVQCTILADRILGLPSESGRAPKGA